MWASEEKRLTIQKQGDEQSAGLDDLHVGEKEWKVLVLLRRWRGQPSQGFRPIPASRLNFVSRLRVWSIAWVLRACRNRSEPSWLFPTTSPIVPTSTFLICPFHVVILTSIYHMQANIYFRFIFWPPRLLLRLNHPCKALRTVPSPEWGLSMP